MTDRDPHPDSPPGDDHDHRDDVEHASDIADKAQRGEVRNQDDDAQ